MICQFTVKSKDVYISASSIVGVLPCKVVGNSDIYCEDPLGIITVDQPTVVAAGIWQAALTDYEEEEEEEDAQP
jgi:hypothetical protein